MVVKLLQLERKQRERFSSGRGRSRPSPWPAPVCCVLSLTMSPSVSGATSVEPARRCPGGVDDQPSSPPRPWPGCRRPSRTAPRGPPGAQRPSLLTRGLYLATQGPGRRGSSFPSPPSARRRRRDPGEGARRRRAALSPSGSAK